MSPIPPPTGYPIRLLTLFKQVTYHTLPFLGITAKQRPAPSFHRAGRFKETSCLHIMSVYTLPGTALLRMGTGRPLPRQSAHARPEPADVS